MISQLRTLSRHWSTTTGARGSSLCLRVSIPSFFPKPFYATKNFCALPVSGLCWNLPLGRFPFSSSTPSSIIKTIYRPLVSSHGATPRYFSRLLNPLQARKSHLNKSDVKYLHARLLSRAFPTNSGGISCKKDDDEQLSLSDRLIKSFGWAMGFNSDHQVMLRSAARMYSCCDKQAKRQEFYDVCKMPDTMQSRFVVTLVHVWLCMVRLKPEGQEGKYVYKQLVKLFWQDMEHKMSLFGIHDRNIVKESTREFAAQFYGIVFAFDEGILEGDAVLAAAIWRNLMNARKHDLRMEDLAIMVAYIRREVKALDEMSSDDVLRKGIVRFGEPPVMPERTVYSKV